MRSKVGKSPEVFDKLTVPAEAVRMTFYQLSVMINSGINLLDALNIMKESPDNHPGMEEVLNQVAIDIQSGFTFSKSLTRYPRVFPSAIVELIRVGEETGRLAKILTRCSEWLAKQNDLRRKTAGALTYPAVVGFVAICVNLLVLNVSMPQMNEMLVSLQVETPPLTRVVFGLGNAVSNPLVLGSVAITLTVLWSYRRRFLKFKHRLALTRILQKLPVVGPLLKATAVARIASTLTICMEVNLNVLTSLTLSVNSCGNPAYKASLKTVLSMIREGDTIAQAFAAFPHLYPATFCHFLEVGEEAGKLTATLKSVITLLELEVDSQVETLSAVAEPIMLSCCAVFVGVFVLATLMPLQKFLSTLMT
jgi:type IV pilus assembly protein PilC